LHPKVRIEKVGDGIEGVIIDPAAGPVKAATEGPLTWDCVAPRMGLLFHRGLTMRSVVAIIFVTLAGSAVLAQDLDKQEKDLLDSIKARLKSARQNLVRGIDRIVSEELKGAKVASKVQEQIKKLQERLSALRKEEQQILSQIMSLKWAAQDSAIIEELKKEGMTPQDASTLFNECLEALQDRDFGPSIKGFKKIWYGFANHRDPRFRQFAGTSAYNVACGYSLMGKKADALDWLEFSFIRGFLQREDDPLGHIKQDTDLDNIRNEERFKELIKKYSAK
jgi:hypothetical protein